MFGTGVEAIAIYVVAAKAAAETVETLRELTAEELDIVAGGANVKNPLSVGPESSSAKTKFS